jgi:DNA-directed RNA polymerase II subunit RPB1
MPAGFYAPSSEIEPIVGIQICIFSPEEIERRSVVEITNGGTYEGNEPKIGGLFDPRMGVLDNGRECRSCGQTNHKCPGHFGHFRLARPVYYIQFLPFIQNVLSCVCIRCSKLLIDKKFRKHLLKRKGEARWREVLTASKEMKRCGYETEDGCGARQPTRYVREGIARIVAEWDDLDNVGEDNRPEKQRQPLEVEFVLRLFRRILDEDVDFMGLSRFWCRPDWMICTVLPIPPPQVRPSVIQDNNQRSEDDLTHKLAEIIKTNNTYLMPRIQANAAKSVIDEWTNVLQYHIATLVDNQIPGVAPSAQRNGRPLKSIQQRLGSKEGRIRYNIQGKRVEFSARSVITPDPNISIAELGVPEKIAMNLTRPERVTEFNLKRLYKFVQNGPDKFPGAKTIRRADGRIISLRHVKTGEITLHYGDIVNRHLMDGDIVLFNRQPTLHRMSMMAHKVKVLKYKTFRLNVSVTAPYNADFDGDEMNMHCPQSYEAATELEEIAAVPHQILRPRDGIPVIGVVQDTLVGSYRLTREHVKFNRREFMNLMMWNKNFEGVVPSPKDDARWTGHQVLSQLMPPINMEMNNSSKKKVVIREGEVKEGQFDKSVFSKASKGIIHMTFNDYGSKRTVNFIDSMQNTIEQFLVYNGFSVGISDLIADSTTKGEMNVKIQEKKSDVETILLSLHQDLFDNNTGKSNQAEFEDKIFGILNKATELAGDIGYNSLANENRMTAMVRAGSKGGPINIAQMIACVGQQNIDGKRIPYGFEDRTLPHFKKYDDGAEARGFIENSFINGLSPTEFFFHAMSGREGLIDTAVKTASTGYIQRRLVKAMEDLVVQHDGSVRDANMNIAQFHYGEDGINSTKIESQSLDMAKLTDADILRDFGLEGVDLAAVLADGADRGDDAELLKDFVKSVKDDQKMVVEGVFRSGNQGSIFAAVNLERLILNIKTKFGLNTGLKTNLTPRHVIAGITAVLEKTQSFHKMWAALLRYHLCPMKLIVEQRFTESAFDTLCEVLVTKNWQAWVQPGEQVGIIAAQSIGEPSTQMSCSYHTFVQLSKNGGNEVGSIGSIIDKIIAQNADDVIQIGHNSVVLDLAEDFYIMGVSNDEKTSWKRISQVSRHPANGGLVKVVTKSGRSTTATLSHSFLKRTEKGVEPILGSDLRVGMRVPIATKVEQVPLSLITQHSGFTLDRAFGWLCGMYLADGSFNGSTVRITKIHPVVEASIRTLATKYNWKISVKEYVGEYGPGKDTNIHSKELRDFLSAEFKTGSYEKTVGPVTYSAPKEFQLGLLSGYFDGDGNVNSDKQMIRVGSRSKDLIRHVNRLLSYCGFFAALGEEASIRMPGKVMHTISILKKYAALFKERIGFTLEEKVVALDEIIAYMARPNKHDTKELYDKIPACGRLIAEVGKALNMPGQSRNYGRWLKKESVGRLTLAKYVEDFTAAAASGNATKEVLEKIATLRSAVDADVVWDEIVELVYLDDPQVFVYDFTVPGNDSFMVDDAIMVHNTLNTFHLAGVASKSNVTRGVPRLEELLKVTQNPKAISLTIPLKKEYSNSKAKAREVAQELELTLLRDMTIKTAIYYDPTDSATVLKEDRELLAFYKMFEAAEAVEETWSKYVLRLEFNRQNMFDKNITMDDILFVLRRRFEDDINLIYSDFNSQKLVMRIRISKAAESEEKTNPSSLDALTAYKKFQNKLLNSVIIRGVPGIKAATFRKGSERLAYNKADGKYEIAEEYILDTDGSNFLEVMNHPAVDASRVTSTHVHDIYSQLGIEATRQTLYTEITTLFEEGQINYRHLGLLVDVMTRAGRLMSVDRYGINKLDIGPLAKASFEETERILLKAAVFGEIDPVTGVSANVMAGQPIRGGTAFSDILLDEVAVMRLQKGLPPSKPLQGEAPAPTEEEVEEEYRQAQDDMCSAARLKMNLTLPSSTVNLEDEPDVEFVELVDE